MYFVSDKGRAVRALQRMLRVPESGRLDRRTRDKIAEITGNSESSEVGYRDFLLIKEAYNKRKRSAVVREYMGFSVDERSMQEYSRGELTKINLLLSKAMQKNRLDGYPPRGGRYSKESAGAVSSLRKMLSLPEKDGVDSELLFGIIMNLRAHEIKNNHLG